jgi:endo-1,4-beta-xylanase
VRAPLAPPRSRARTTPYLHLILGATVLCAACGSQLSGVAPEPSDSTSMQSVPLRDLARRHGREIGAAIDRLFVSPERGTTPYMTILGREFGVITAENDMKFQRLRPARGVFRFARADSLLAYAESRGMRMRGHTLVWHRQLASWLTNGTWTAEEARQQLREHIDSVVGHYRGRLAAWDVVNEAIADDATRRTTFWSTHIGAEYIEMAFRWAHEADPDVELFYNDYGIERIHAKSDSTYATLKDLLDRGVPVHGIGFQAHLTGGNLPPKEELLSNFRRFADLGLRIHITELDIRLRTPASAADLQMQANDYATIVNVCLEVPACDMIVLWGFTDLDSWIPGSFPGFGQALIHDEEFAEKPAYRAVREALRLY